MSRKMSVDARRVIERFNRVTGAQVKTTHELNAYADEHPEIFPLLGLPVPPTANERTSRSDPEPASLQNQEGLK